MELAPAVKPYFRDERIVVLPRRRTARLAVLDLLAGQFEPGLRFKETEVNEVLAKFHPDYCALRRYLVEEDFLARHSGVYWRTGGTVEV